MISFLKKKSFVYLFLAVLGLHCCTGFSLVAAHRFLMAVASIFADHRLSGPGSVAVAHGLSCCMTRGIFPDQGSKLCLLNWQADSSSLSHQVSPISFFSGRHGREEEKGGVSEHHLQWYAYANRPWSCSSLHDIAVARENVCSWGQNKPSSLQSVFDLELFTTLRRTMQISVTDITRTKDFTFMETFQKVTVDVLTQLGTQVQFSSLRIIFSD